MDEEWDGCNWTGYFNGFADVTSLQSYWGIQEDYKLRDLVVKDGLTNNVIVNGKQQQLIISDDSKEAMKHAFELFNVRLEVDFGTSDIGHSLGL
ncbi:hypothetical protein Pyn_35955 [Prunus yedoensis var. nudiflora]|uniref:Uncharacterized protein n=1 Tax=Prunus yedoensis var. nudiflora TaxID=2094558 RepID=A0A314ZGG9_PRUYE|nr:hypothetical protein Pyn_35955 [Prunus yedoensis var. nudiflora]